MVIVKEDSLVSEGATGDSQGRFGDSEGIKW